MPDPEVPERPVRRRFTAEYKLRIVEEANAATEPGAVGALLRREGLAGPALVVVAALGERDPQELAHGSVLVWTVAVASAAWARVRQAVRTKLISALPVQSASTLGPPAVHRTS